MRAIRWLAFMMVPLVIAAPSARGAVIPLTGFGDFTSSTTETQDFESTINGTTFTFDGTAFRGMASTWTDDVTSSGQWGLVEGQAAEPLLATFSQDVFEVGLIFGNDDFNLVFNAILEAFDSANASLGSVSVTSNANDFADQFIGLRSDSAIRSVAISYQRPQAQQLSVFIDDFTVGLDQVSAVPEPSSMAMLSLGGLGMVVAAARRRRSRAAGVSLNSCE